MVELTVIMSVIFALLFVFIKYLATIVKVKHMEKILKNLQNDKFEIDLDIDEYLSSFYNLKFREKLKFNDFSFHAKKDGNEFAYPGFKLNWFGTSKIVAKLDILYDFQMFVGRRMYQDEDFGSDLTSFNTLSYYEIYSNDDKIINYLFSTKHGSAIFSIFERNILYHDELIIKNGSVKLPILNGSRSISVLFEALIQFSELVRTRKFEKLYNSNQEYESSFVEVLTQEEILLIDPTCIVCFNPIIQSQGVYSILRSNLSILSCCGSFAHFGHIEKWIEMKGSCPYCKSIGPHYYRMRPKVNGDAKEKLV